MVRRAEFYLMTAQHSQAEMILIKVYEVLKLDGAESRYEINDTVRM